MLLAGLALLAGQYWLVLAMRTGEIAVVAPFRYSIILWAVLAGFLVWGESPDIASWIGIAVVSAAGLYTRMVSVLTCPQGSPPWPSDRRLKSGVAVGCLSVAALASRGSGALLVIWTRTFARTGTPAASVRLFLVRGAGGGDRLCSWQPLYAACSTV